jgi:PilZ domain
MERSGLFVAGRVPPSSTAGENPTAFDPPTAETRGTDRRTEARYPAREPAELEALFSSTGPIYGTILDVSRSGLRIALPQRVDRGEQVKVKLRESVIFGEVRYCRAASGIFHAGIRIQDLVRSGARPSEHLAEDALSLYAVGKGLSVSEVIEVREHLLRCGDCRDRVAQRQAILNPAPRRRPLA